MKNYCLVLIPVHICVSIETFPPFCLDTEGFQKPPFPLEMFAHNLAFPSNALQKGNIAFHKAHFACVLSVPMSQPLPGFAKYACAMTTFCLFC